MFNEGIVRKGRHGGVSYSIEAIPNSDKVILEFQSEQATGKSFSPTDYDSITATNRLELTCEQANQFAKMLQDMAKQSQRKSTVALSESSYKD